MVAHDLESEAAGVEAPLEVSVVMPCLNEADTLEICIRKAQTALRDHGIAGEIIVADNGSTDGSLPSPSASASAWFTSRTGDTGAP